MSLFDERKLNFNSNAPENTQRGNFRFKDKTQQEVIFVPNEKGRFLIATP